MVVAVAAKPRTVSKWRQRVPSWLVPLESSIVSSWTAQWMALDAAAAAAPVDDGEEDDNKSDITVSESELLEQPSAKRTDGRSQWSKPSLDSKDKQSKGNDKSRKMEQERKISFSKNAQVDEEEENYSEEGEEEDDSSEPEGVDQQEQAWSDLSKLSNQTASFYASNFSLPEIVFDRENVSSFASSGYVSCTKRGLFISVRNGRIAHRRSQSFSETPVG